VNGNVPEVCVTAKGAAAGDWAGPFLTVWRAPATPFTSLDGRIVMTCTPP
jgi:hypothetical protein